MIRIQPIFCRVCLPSSVRFLSVASWCYRFMLFFWVVFLCTAFAVLGQMGSCSAGSCMLVVLFLVVDLLLLSSSASPSIVCLVVYAAWLFCS